MAVVTTTFPSLRPGGEPQPLAAAVLWAIARDVRRQICGGLWAKPLSAGDLIRRVSRLAVNGVRLTVLWDGENEIHDDDGNPVAGVCETDPDSPGTVFLSLNPAVVGDHPTLAASTAAHELGHAIFDGPASVLASQRLFRDVVVDEGHFEGGGPRDDRHWSEYRANEFMGGLLAPPDLLHRAMVIRARQLDIALVRAGGHAGKPGYPVIDGGQWTDFQQDALLDDLAETFGLSAVFLWVRLNKYRLVAGQGRGRG